MIGVTGEGEPQRLDPTQVGPGAAESQVTAHARFPTTQFEDVAVRLHQMNAELDVVVVGGCGHVGLPLGLALAESGLRVVLYDTSADAVATVERGVMPFEEPGAAELLGTVLHSRLTATTDPSVISQTACVIVVIGTPVDEHLNPNPAIVTTAVDELSSRLRDGQLLILRSTVYPGTTAVVERSLEGLGLEIDVAFCPERIAEGRALKELRELPQIVAARQDRGYKRASDLFGHLTKQIVRMEPEEAELAKLFTNTWRYIKFAIANQLFMIATDFGLDYETIRRGLSKDYPRAADLPSAGFAAGPCLLKDTMQLAAFNNNNFLLGHSAMMVNEGLPLYVVSKLESQYKISEMTVGILGMAFKEESDDVRSSLSYKLRRILRFKAKGVICTDPFVNVDPSLSPLDEVLNTADLIVIGAPHRLYREVKFAVPVIDIWGALGGPSGL
jgi:UDP-N-acetyl-D-mannosaminuronic acid dehydrogenase